VANGLMHRSLVGGCSDRYISISVLLFFTDNFAEDEF